MESKLSLETKYKAKISFDDHSSANDILVSYYLPLIKSEAFSLYNALMIDSRNTMINTLFIDIDRLISMINISFERLEKAITKLELVNLLEVYEDEDKNLIFILLKPLTPQEFNNSFQLSELFKSKSGNNNLEISNKLFNSMKNNNREGNVLLTQETNLNISADGIVKDKLNVEFDFTNIKSILNARGIDYSHIWSTELERKLIDLIVVYRISSLDIGVEIVLLIENGNFSIEGLVKKIQEDFTNDKTIDSLAKSGEVTTQVKLDYITSVSTRDYFISRLNREPSNTEQQMISDLNTKYGFKDEIVNILIDFSIIVNSGAVNKNYITKIADTLLKEGYKTVDEITRYLKVAYNLKKEDKTKSSLNSKELMEEIPVF